MWSAIFIVSIFVLNTVSVKWFAETEAWLASVKVFAIIGFIVLGALAMFGALPLQNDAEAPGFSNIFADGLFPNGFMAVFTVMLTVNFACSGTELIGVAAGEAKGPERLIPRAIHSTLWRLAIFFVLAIVVMSALIPYRTQEWSRAPSSWSLK